MLSNCKIVVVMPAYNAARTLERTITEIPSDIVDELLVVDDASRDQTAQLCRKLGVRCFVHQHNHGYGGNQKTCYTEALKLGADIVIMLHPDYQYPPQLIPDLARLISDEGYDIAIGSRILGGEALKGNMPRYKFMANRFLTYVQNLVIGTSLSEYHTGFRAFSSKTLKRIPFHGNSDGFLFDNQILLQALYFGYTIGEIPCPARYFPEASSITFFQSVKYGVGVLYTTVKYFAQKNGLASFPLFIDRNHSMSHRPAVR